MPFERPTLDALLRRVSSDIVSELGVGALLRRGVLRAASNAMAGLAHHMHGALEQASLEWPPNPLTSSDQLDAAAAIYKVRRKPPAQATGTVLLTGTIGLTVPDGTELSSIDGVLYRTVGDVTFDAVDELATVLAVLGGIEGNQDVDAELTFRNPLAGVDSVAVVQDGGSGAGLVGGDDLESDAELLDRIYDEARNPSGGGSPNDWVKWAKAVPGVTRAWAFGAWGGSPNVGLTFVLDGDPASIVPNGAKINEVVAYVSDPDRKPITSVPVVFAPTLKSVNFDITLAPNSSALQESVEASIRDLVRREAVPGSPLLISRVREAVSTTPGEINSTVNLPSGDVSSVAGELIVPGTFTFS